jgi:hypothetical protein
LTPRTPSPNMAKKKATKATPAAEPPPATKSAIPPPSQQATPGTPDKPRKKYRRGSRGGEAKRKACRPGAAGLPPSITPAVKSSAADTAIIRRAFEERWPIPDKFRGPLINRQIEIATHKHSSPTEATNAFRSVLAADILNQRSEELAFERARDAVNNNARREIERIQAEHEAERQAAQGNPQPSQTQVNVLVTSDLRHAMLADPEYVEFMRVKAAEKLAQAKASSTSSTSSGNGKGNGHK